MNQFDVDESVAADMEFHREIAKFSGNQIARLLLESLEELREACHAKGFRGQTSNCTKAAHSGILTAIRNGQGEAARIAMERHLLRAGTELGFSANDLSA